MARRVAVLALLCGVAASCRRGEPPGPPPGEARTAPVSPVSPVARDAALAPADGAPAAEWYRATVGRDAQEVPFFVRMPPPEVAGGCVIVNGDEQLDVVCRWQDASSVVLEFPVFGTSIRATRGADGALTGSWQMSRISGAVPAPFAATRVAGPDPDLRFPAVAGADGAPADFAGTWRFKFTELDVGKGTLAQTPGGVVTGTIIPRAIGDMRYLAGNARGRALALSTFDGQHAYVVRAELDARHGTLRGTWAFTQVVADRFTARRVAELDIAVVAKLRLRPGATRVTVPQLEDARYRGKPVIVDYFGTWCPACIDETPYLVDLYRRRHAAGLEILSIALEGTTDDAYNRGQVEYFRKRYAIPWQIDVVAGEYAESEKLLPPELIGTGGYPVTLFLDRDHRVRDMHSGFIGPAAGDDHRRLTARFERNVDAMLASPPPP